MSNNLVSQQMSIESIQTSQLEPISNKMDSSTHMGMMGAGVNGPGMQHMSMPNMRMGILGHGSRDTPLQQVSVSGHQEQPFETMPYNHLLQRLQVSNMQTGQVDQRAYNMIPEQFLIPNKQLGGMETMLNNVGSQQSSMSIKRKAPMEPTSNTPGLQKLSAPNKRATHMENRPWLHQVSSPNKLPVQMQPQSTSNNSGAQRSQVQLKRSASTKSGTQQLSVQKNQSGQPSPKFQNESLESVRSKLRESLAGALALVCREQDKTTSVGKPSENVCTQENSQPSGHGTTASDASKRISEENKESLPIKEDTLAQKCIDGQNSSQEISFNNAGDFTETSKVDGQTCQSTIVSRDEDMSFSDGSFFRDELLQGNGLSWVLESDVGLAQRKEAEVVRKQPDQTDSCRVSRAQASQTPEIVASKIESELYKLFGGVNKKYKEKGRSLLFNLKDRNNPELRERVMSGEIAPDRLCSMTAEELASKELSEWRMAKAEELAQMVVLPDSDVDMRRLVKKTHKGEFQVEVEPQDSVSVEVAVGASSLTQTRPKSKEKEASSSSLPDKKKDKRNATSEKNSSEENVLMIPSTEGTDLMQGLIDDELKDTEFLPPIVSLDEFMESLNSEPPFENLPGDSGKPTPASDKDDSRVGSESKSPDATSKHPDDTNPGKPGTSSVLSAKSDADGISAGKHLTSESISVGIPKGEHVWEGSLQLNLSALVSVISYYKSGEKATPKGWPGLVDIKGRVRLDAFEKFLQELPMSRSRSVMAVHFVCKEGSAESERASMKEVADSYVLDERVGFAEPVPGVELYFCPPHSKTKEMVGKVLPKDQFDALNAIDYGLIGVIVWRKPHVTSTISPKSASHHKHNSKKQHPTSRRHQEKDANLNVNVMSKHPSPHGGFSKTQADDDDDVPPGFGPPAGATRDEDDLPEFNFSSGSGTPRPPFPNQNANRGQFPPNSQTLPRPVDQMRELVHRYGQPEVSASSGSWQDKRGVGIVGQQWNDDDDDMPEWHPDDAKKPLQPQPQPQPQPQSHSIHMPSNNIVPPPVLRPHMMQQTPYQQMAPQAQALPSQTQMNAAPSWPQGQWLVPNSASQGIPTFQPNSGGQFYGTGQQGVPWRRDAPTSRGF